MSYDAAVTFDRANGPLMRALDAVPDAQWQQALPGGRTRAAAVLDLVDAQREDLQRDGAQLNLLPEEMRRTPATLWRTHAEMVVRLLTENAARQHLFGDVEATIDEAVEQMEALRDELAAAVAADLPRGPEHGSGLR